MAGLHLAEYLGAAARRKFVWGEFDCFLFVANWVFEQTGIDPAGEYRGAYTTAREGRSLMRANGGVLAFAHDRLTTAGCRSADDSHSGDIGLARIGFKRWRNRIVMVPAGAIRVRKNLWAVKPADGRQLLVQQFSVLKTWNLPNAGSDRSNHH